MHLTCVDIVNDTIKFTNISNNEINDELPNNTSCKYYSVNEYYQISNSEYKSLNIFHSNVNGLESKLGNLHEFLSSSNHKMDILSITETSETEIGFLKNVDLEGYEKFHTASKSSKGGTAIYINNKLDVVERNDLKIEHDEFEGTWVEIKNTNSINIISGCIYRHPHNNFNDFFNYLDKCLGKLAKENKEVYISGDFNFDLLKINSDPITENFFNIMCSYGFLPNIFQPTRVTENTATVIDNIFSNSIHNNIISGNILLTLSEYFSQFISVNRGKIDYKKSEVFIRDYSKFSSESFRDDISIQNWNYTYDNVNDSFNDFYHKLDGSVNRHAPLKKLTPKEIKLKNKPWITPEILKMIKIRNKIFARKKRQPNNEDCKRLYNLFRNRVNRELKDLKRSIMQIILKTILII